MEEDMVDKPSTSRPGRQKQKRSPADRLLTTGTIKNKPELNEEDLKKVTGGATSRDDDHKGNLT
jgi:hypothetical protein